jgi:glycine hydroxymethyltransferase
MMQGGRRCTTIAAKAVNFKECATPEYAEYARQVVDNAQQLATSLGRRGHPADHRRHRHAPVLHDLQGVGVTGAEAEARADAAGSSSTRTPFRSTRRSRTSRRASGSVRRV